MTGLFSISIKKRPNVGESIQTCDVDILNQPITSPPALEIQRSFFNHILGS